MRVCRSAAKLLQVFEHAVAILLQLQLSCKHDTCTACTAAAVMLQLYSKNGARPAAAAVQLLSSLQDVATLLVACAADVVI